MRFYGIPGSVVALVGAIGAVALILMYTVRWRLPQRVIGTTALWLKVMARHRGAGRLGALDHVLSLLYQLAILSALVLALGQPRLSCQSAGGRAVVIVLDRSASMATAEGLEPRYETARRRALRRLDATAATDRVALVLAGGAPEIAAPLGSTTSRMREAIEASAVRARPGELTRAVALACDLLQGSEPASLVVITDGSEPVGTCAAAAIEPIFIGAAHPNVGLTALSTGFSPKDAFHAEGFVEILDAWQTPAHVELRVDLDGNLLEVSQLDLEPGVPLKRVLSGIALTGTGRLRARLSKIAFDGGGEDTLHEDNTAFAVVPRRNAIPIDLIGDSEPLKLVLAANPRYAVTRRRDLGEARGAIKVIAGEVRGTLGPGRFLLVNPSGAGLPFRLGAPVPEVAISNIDVDHPILRRVILSDVFIRAATTTQLPGSATAIVRSPSTPLLYTLVDGPLRLVGLSFDLLDTDLPLRVGFPVLVYNAVDWLLQSNEVQSEDGDFIRSDEPVMLTPPRGARQRLEPIAGRVSVPVGEPGFYEVSTLAGQPLAPLGVSVLSQAETRNAPQAATTAAVGPRQAGRPWDREPSTWLIMTALLLLLIEWFTYHRRITV